MPNLLFGSNFFQARARSARARRACALRALGLLLADGTPTVGGGDDFFDGSAGFFYENSCNSRTESRKNHFQGGKLTVMPRAKNGSSTKIGGSMAKIGIFGQKPNFGPKKGIHFLI